MDAANSGPWTRDATMRYLNARPLPRTFMWPHRDADDNKDRPVWPVHGSVIGYGKWLREVPYFPGLFELVHDVLAAAPDEFNAEWLPFELQRVREKFANEPARAGEHLAHKIRRLMPAANQATFL